MVTSKKGGVSDFIVFFGATIAIAIILTVFVLGAGMVNKINNVGANVAIYNESRVEVDNIFEYSERYILLNEARFSIMGGKDLDEALKERDDRISIMKEEMNNKFGNMVAK